MLLTIQAAIPALEADGGGSIITASSVAGLRYAGAALTAYSASKAGIIGLMPSTLARDESRWITGQALVVEAGLTVTTRADRVLTGRPQ